MKTLTLLLTLLCLHAYSQEDCIFNQSTQTAEFIQDIPEFKNYTWNDITKEATILLSNGDTLVAHRGGYVHFGISGTLKIFANKTELSKVKL